MPKTAQHLPRTLKDPQSWISLIGVVTVIGLCAGAFEPGNAAPAAPLRQAAQAAAKTEHQAKAQPAPVVARQQPAGKLLALNNR